MTSIKSIIVDDEESNRSNLSSLLNKHCPSIDIIAEAENIIEAKKAIENLKPQLVFLDVRMPGGDAFELLSNLDNIFFEIIFITAFDQYAFQAFRFNAVDFLLKPIDVEDLKIAVEKVSNKLKEKEENIFLKNLITNQNLEHQEQRIPLATESKVEFIPVKSIIRCEGERNYTRFYLKNDKSLLICKTLKEYEKALLYFQFLRVHQSHLINLKEVIAYHRRDGGYLQMSDNSNVPISRSRKEEVQEKLLNI
ncbi:LytR/AlgR family response regulator transcription factor [Bacteroidota bacterium]